jgi:protease I
MSDQLQNERIAILVANEGVEQVELTSPRDALREAGADVDLLAPEDSKIQAFNHLDKGDTFTPDKAVGEADPDNYDGLVLPGGVANPDRLRTDTDAVQFVRAFFEAGKPVGAICHGPWTLINATSSTAARSPRGRACRPTCATQAPIGSTRRSTSTRGW